MVGHAFLHSIPTTTPLHNFTSCTCTRRYGVITIRASTTSPNPPNPKITPLRVAAATAYAAYIPLIFLFSNGAEPGTPAHPAYALREAIELSLNFAFVTPLVFPKLAPVFSPTYEALFNLVIAWAALFFGFLAEDIDTDEKNSYPPYRWVAYAQLFLTNIIFLPYLVVRTPRNPKDNQSKAELPAAPDFQLAESSFLPKSILGLTAASVAWFAFGRPEFGPLATRFNDIVHLWNTNILAHSLMLDMVAFALFQGALVTDDANRRNWQGPQRDNAVTAARFRPFFGLMYYLWKRSQLAPLKNKL